MGSKRWLWVVIAGLVIVTIHQIITLQKGGSEEPQSPEVGPAPGSDQRTTHVASIGELPGMLSENGKPAIESAEAEEQDQTSTVAMEGSEPGPEEAESDTAEPTETVEVTPVQDMPLPAVDQLEMEAIPQSSGVGALVKFSNKGLVRGIVYSDEHGSALIDETIVQTGGTIDGIKVVNIHAGGVDFERNGRRWTQRVGELPESAWR